MPRLAGNLVFCLFGCLLCACCSFTCWCSNYLIFYFPFDCCFLYEAMRKQRHNCLLFVYHFISLFCFVCYMSFQAYVLCVFPLNIFCSGFYWASSSPATPSLCSSSSRWRSTKPSFRSRWTWCSPRWRSWTCPPLSFSSSTLLPQSSRSRTQICFDLTLIFSQNGSSFDISKQTNNSLQVAILLYLCQILVYWMWKRGVDPDNAAIPYLTAVIHHITTKHVQYHIIYSTSTKSTFIPSTKERKSWITNSMISGSRLRLEIFWGQVFSLWHSWRSRKWVYILIENDFFVDFVTKIA